MKRAYEVKLPFENIEGGFFVLVETLSLQGAERGRERMMEFIESVSDIIEVSELLLGVTVDSP